MSLIDRQKCSYSGHVGNRILPRKNFYNSRTGYCKECQKKYVKGGRGKKRLEDLTRFVLKEGLKEQGVYERHINMIHGSKTNICAVTRLRLELLLMVYLEKETNGYISDIKVFNEIEEAPHRVIRPVAIREQEDGTEAQYFIVAGRYWKESYKYIINTRTRIPVRIYLMGDASEQKDYDLEDSLNALQQDYSIFRGML